jgi:hypothetical protein
MTAATRERKLALINDCGPHTLRNLVLAALSVKGNDFLTDEQIHELTEALIVDERRRTHSNIDNRARMAALEEVA